MSVVAVVQRWEHRRARFKPAGERINTHAHEVAALDERAAKAFVLEHHYSGTFPAARFRFGLYRGAELVGAAVFSHPCNDAVLTNVFPGQATDAAELGRFVLLNGVAGNGESWFLGRCFEQLRAEGLRGVVSFSDPLPRQDETGAMVMPGHVGVIYQAHNGVYLGRSRANTVYFLPNGSVFNNRTAGKIRRLEQGWRYAVEQLINAGAPRPDTGDLGDWLRRVTAGLRRVRHPGNHKYAWGLSRRDKRSLPESQPYPRRAA